MRSVFIVVLVGMLEGCTVIREPQQPPADTGTQSRLVELERRMARVEAQLEVRASTRPPG